MEAMFRAFEKCLDLRDKYMFKSRQRLGDNPKDYDDHFHGFEDSQADVSGAKPCIAPSDIRPATESFAKWKIYPEPPPPHWHWKQDDTVVSTNGHHTPKKFNMEDCTIPESDSWGFEIDEKGQYLRTLSGRVG